MRVGLVLGAGGVLGGAWLVGGLHALATETDWVYRWHPAVPVLGPGSWRLALASLARPYRYSPAALLAGWLPRGLISSEPLKQTIRRVAGEEWAPHPNLWIMACDYANGRRVAFGRDDAPRASLADAVAASCAIPAFYRPVRIGARRYVDGGVASTSNLDLLADRDLDLMNSTRRHQVIEVAAETVARHLRAPAVHEQLQGLPAGDPVLVRRPQQPVDARVDFFALADERWAATR